MNNQKSTPSPALYARTIGALYVSLFFLGPLAFFMGRTSVYNPGDAAATISALMASESVFRAGLVAEGLIVLIEIIVSAFLYVLLKPVSKPLALASSFARFAQAIVQAVNLLTAVPALQLFGSPGFAPSMQPVHTNAIVMLFMEMNAFGIFVWGLLFGFHLFLLSVLVYRSGFLPKILGVLLALASVGYLAQSFGHIIYPSLDSVLANVVILLSIPGEISFTLWLLIKTVNVKRWNESNEDFVGSV